MEIEVLKKILQDNAAAYSSRVANIETAERYYLNDTAIMYQDKKDDETGDPLHNADNRIPGGFHRLLVKQKAAYLLTYPPMVDIGSPEANDKVSAALGDKYAKRCKRLCVNASNAGDAWVHYWDDNGEFKWSVIKSQQIQAIWSDDLEEELVGIIRSYRQLDQEDGKWYIVYEVWSDTTCESYRCLEAGTINDIESYDMFAYAGNADGEEGATDTYEHDFGRVPFIRFSNNDECMSDLTRTLKGLIDSYDKTYCGFVNDLEDIQEIIFILTGYEGEDLNGFLQEIKKYKTIKLDADKDSNAGLQTLNIEIPVEAREKLLEITRKAIFEQGQGVDPLQESFGTKSGEALKFMYALLELKAGDMETEFRAGFAELVRAICEHEGIRCDSITQTWTRNAIRNEKEQADICKNSVGIISNRTIVANHPHVDNVEDELEQMEEDKKQAIEDQDMFFGQNENVDEEDSEDVETEE